MSYKTIRVPEKTYERLAELGTLKDSFGSVIDRLIESGSMQVPKPEAVKK